MMKKTADFCNQIIDSMETAAVLLDLELCIVYLNPAAEALFERSANRVVGESLGALIHTSLLPGVLKSVAADHNRLVRREIPLSLSSGKNVVVNLSATPLQTGLILLEIRQIDHHLDISQSETRQIEYHATRKLMRGMAHEIKNPLGGIRGAAQLLARQFPSNGVEEYTHVIITETDRLRTLLDRMLGPQSPPAFNLINVHEAVEHVYRLLKAEVSDTIQLHRDYDPSIPETLADKDQLIQAVLNVTRNAAEAVGNQGEITLRTRVLRRYSLGVTLHPLVIQISIEDNGPGIPAAIQSEVFFPMVTNKASGSGLGLSITQSLIQNHQGLVKFHSVPGKTCFEILLPVRDTE